MTEPKLTNAQAKNIRSWHDELMRTTRKQAQDVLMRKDESCCCLGIYVADVKRRKPREVSEQSTSEFIEDEECYVFKDRDSIVYLNLPADCQLKDINGNLGYDPLLKIPTKLRMKSDRKSTAHATCLNDSYNFTFKQIAACIRHSFPSLFEDYKK